MDALDEAEDAGFAAAANHLYLPPLLPPGVFFVLSSRELIDYRLDVGPHEDVPIGDQDPANLEDVRRYVRDFVLRHPTDMVERITAWGGSEKAFADLLTDKSQGNFLYLTLVPEDIRKGRLSPDTIDNITNLPDRLQGYYERHWRMVSDRDPDRFERIYEPVLRFLATAREPVAIEELQT